MIERQCLAGSHEALKRRSHILTLTIEGLTPLDYLPWCTGHAADGATERINPCMFELSTVNARVGY